MQAKRSNRFRDGHFAGPTDSLGPTAGTHQVLGGLIFAKATEGHPDTDISHIMGKLHAQRIG